jgi:putative ABC transport system permease protein
MRGLSANKLRSSLTVLAILIGVGAVIILVAVGNGSSQAVQNRIKALGTNTITIVNRGPVPNPPVISTPPNSSPSHWAVSPLRSQSAASG